MDIAASLQKLIEEFILNLARATRKTTGAKNLCLAGGVAHNIIANAQLRESKIFNDVFIHFASGDSGSAMGAALYGYYRLSHAPRKIIKADPYLGSDYDENTVVQSIKQRGLKYEQLTREDLLERVADLVNDDFIVGWFQGRMEFGPRALGHRSILANPCN